ncbi:MAG: hypothetical protein OXF76_15580 [Caldilineaceae bacterium]|nr:hypothetical protein [Caldilineaceae bacterium]
MSASPAESTNYRRRPHAARVAIALLLATLVMSGCVLDRFFGTPPVPTPLATELAPPSEEDDTLARLIERATNDLVSVTNAAAGEITLISTEEVEWGDASLGCPEPDTMYAQVITPGYVIVLESGGDTYDYHTGIDPDGPLVQCTEEGVPAGADPIEIEPAEGAVDLIDDQTLPRLTERAIDNLVQTTDAAADEITVVSTEEVEWSDSSLGCPEPDTMYAQVITPGYLIVLESGGDTYEYHTGADPEGPLVQCLEGAPAAADAQMGGAIAPLGGVEDIVLARLIERAMDNLVEATGAAAAEISVVSTEQVEWSDTSLGCPEPDTMYAQIITPGYRIVLEVGGSTHDYRAGVDPEGPLVQCSQDADSGQ